MVQEGLQGEVTEPTGRLRAEYGMITENVHRLVIGTATPAREMRLQEGTPQVPLQEKPERRGSATGIQRAARGRGQPRQNISATQELQAYVVPPGR